MADFLKSAFNIFANSTQVGKTSAPNNDFVGQNIVINNQRLRIAKQLAEGGYAIVYIAQDLSNGNEYALKRMFAADKSANQAILDEISYLKKVNNPYIIKFVAAACEEKEGLRKEYLILTELCKNGTLIDYLRSNELNSEQVIQVFYQICKSIQYLHSKDPPIVHRDIKIDNYLISSDGTLKLCDFGSATTTQYYPDDTWNSNKRSLVEDDIAKQTTPMYRAPEMLDLYSNFPINAQSDIWALGCILYVLCFNKHPFEDSAKLRIINGNYVIPTNPEFTDFHDLLRCMFNVDPRKRPTIDEIVYHLENVAESRSVELKASLRFLLVQSGNNTNTLNTVPSQTMPTRLTTSQQQQQSDGQTWIDNATSLFKGGLKTIKEASTKVIDTVQNTINRTDLDMNYLTPRVLIMSCPSEGLAAAATFGNNIDLVKDVIERKHGTSYCIYNLSSKTYRKEKFAKVIDIAGLTSHRAPPISLIFKICANIYKHLTQNPKNIAVVHCNDGRALCAVISSSFILFCGFLKTVDQSLSLFNIKRGTTQLTASQYRYLGYVHRIMCDGYVPLENDFQLNTIVMHTVPVFDRARNGCVPYVEIYSKDQKIYTNYQAFQSMRKYSAHQDSQIVMNINFKLYGDITIVVYNAKATNSRAQSERICEFQFHTGFLTSNKMRWSKSDLDGLDNADKYADGFAIFLDFEMKSSVCLSSHDEAWNMTTLTDPKQSTILFDTQNEIVETLELIDASTKPYSDDNLVEHTTEVGQSKFFTVKVAGDGGHGMATTTTTTTEIGQSKFFMSDNLVENEKAFCEPMANDDDDEFIDGFKNINFGSNTDADGDCEQQSDVQFTPLIEITDDQIKVNEEPLLDFDDNSMSQTTNVPTDLTAQQPNRTGSFTNFDLLLDIDSTMTSSNVESPSPLNPNKPQSTNLDDLLNFDASAFITPTSAISNNQTNVSLNSATVIKPTVQSNVYQNQKTTTTAAKSNQPKDPFADFGIGSMSNSTAKPSTSQPVNANLFATNTIPKVQAQDPFAPKPNYYAASSAFAKTSSQTPNPSQSQAQQQQPKQPPQSNKPAPNPTGIFTGPTKANFEQFLPNDFVRNTKTANMTLKDLKRENMAKDTDPDRLRVSEWVEGKKKNIRALLCSMDKVLWEGATKWDPIGMHQLVTADQVKKVYRKAVLAVHPDKLTDHPQINLARLIFIELNNAWAAFEEEGQQNLY